jgi:hypothetical protein
VRSNLPEPALLFVDGRQQGDLDAGEVRVLDTMSSIPATRRLDVGDVWEFELELADRGLREQIGSLYWGPRPPTLTRHGASDGTHPSPASARPSAAHSSTGSPSLGGRRY